MLPRRDRVVVSLGAESTSARRRRSGSLAWEHISADTVNLEATRDGSDSDGEVGHLAGLVDALRGTNRPEVSVVLAPTLCPGLVVQLGEEPLPRALRERLAAHRLEQVYGIRPEGWTMRLDPRRVTGDVLAFAVMTDRLADITRSFSILSPHSLSVVPSVVWGRALLGERIPDGWFVTDQDGEASITYALDGEVSVLESSDTPPNLPALVREIEFAALRHAIGPASASIVVESSAASLPPGQYRSGGYDLRILDPFAPVRAVQLPDSDRRLAA